MNSSTQETRKIIIDYSIIILALINICISTGLFTCLMYHVIKTRNSPNRVILLLIANMYLALLFCGIMCIIQYFYPLPSQLYLLVSLNDEIYCQIRTYLQLVSVCTIYYSHSIQAIYCLCRIVFYTKRSLQSFRLYKNFVIIQWIICFLIMSPALLVADLKYIKNDYYCQIDFRNLRNILANATVIYLIPIVITFGCYIYTWKNMRRSKNSLIQTTVHNQKLIARRDIIVLSRICILFGLVLSIAIPSLTTLFIYDFTGYLPWWSTEIQWFSFMSTLTIVSVVLALSSPHVRNLRIRHFSRPFQTTV